MTLKNIFLSDLHIGNNAETNWFQKETHLPILKTILRYLVDISSHVNDVVILGDWFEQWNYRPDVHTPDISEIIKRNPELFTKTDDGANFIDLIEAIKGKLRFVNGDHDMLVELKDLNREFSKMTDKKVYPGHGCDFEKSSLANTFYFENGVWAEHGHQHDLFHKPAINEENPCSPLPLGYFISRLFCHFLDKRMASMHRRDASCICGSINSEFSNLSLHFNQFLTELMNDLKRGKPIDAAGLIVDQLMQFHRSFHLDINVKTEGFGEIDSIDVAKFYPGLLTLENLPDGLFEAEVPYAGLGRFARKHFIENPNTNVAIMGHTHLANYELCGSHKRRLYLNTGYLCPSIPDIESGDNYATFAEVSIVNGGGKKVVQKIVVKNTDYEIAEGASSVI
ncbi:MAG: hypothetical protein Kow0029_03200 [Candidatus Rifleibacteriota bacterium]